MSNNQINEQKEQKLSTESYKGVRDFYPPDMAIENSIFEIWRKNAEKYGYEEYGASVLEPANLYKAKSGEEIVNEQTYTFTDRGDREVTLRPEMTPTLARMVAAKKRELIFPLRWYSIPNLFRYEQPQRGRLREHWQLNVDLFGVESINAEIEVINIAYDITKAYGLKDADFEIRINNRKVMNYITKEVFNLDDESAHKISKLIDKKDKIPKEKFDSGVKDIFESSSRITTFEPTNLKDSELTEKISKFLTLLNSKNFEEFVSSLPQTENEHSGIKEIRQTIEGLENLGINNVRFDQTLMRGFDYYTGIVFEVFDLNPDNRRAVFGGGRYDEILSLFGNEKVSAVGFGAGDVVARDLMETYNSLEKFQPQADIAMCIIDDENAEFALNLAKNIREQNIKVFIDLSNKKISDQLKNVDRRNIPFVIVIGSQEVKTDEFTVKRLKDRKEKSFKVDEIGNVASYISS